MPVYLGLMSICVFLWVCGFCWLVCGRQGVGALVCVGCFGGGVQVIGRFGCYVSFGFLGCSGIASFNRLMFFNLRRFIYWGLLCLFSSSNNYQYGQQAIATSTRSVWITFFFKYLSWCSSLSLVWQVLSFL